MLAEDRDLGILAHAAIVDRRLYPGDAVLRTGYVEAVAVAPAWQRRGLGTRVMTIINGLIDDGYELGALGTGAHSFYGRLGWVDWKGPAWIRRAHGGRERAIAEDGTIMVRLTPATPPGLDLSSPIAVDWRPGEAW